MTKTNSFEPKMLEALRLRQRLERVEQQMLDSCPFCWRYRQLEQERWAILDRLKVLGAEPR